MNGNAFLDTLLKLPATHTPIWLMRQAGRYLPEYRQVRSKAGSFMNLCKNPELATEVTLQPLKRFKLDAAIVFSDILVIPDAMGLGLYFSEGEGPKFTHPIQTTIDIDSLKTIDPLIDLKYVMDTVKNIKQELPSGFPLIGFSGSPWTLACYMLEGGSSKNYEKAKSWLYAHPKQLHILLDKIATAVIDYLNCQIDAGIDTIMIFDSWGGVLEHNAFQEFSLYYLNKVLNSIKTTNNGKNIPKITFTKGGAIWLDTLNALNTDGLGVDWTVDIGYARKHGGNKILQGNFDPVILSVGTKDVIKSEVKRILNSYKQANNESLEGLIFNLGHGILPSAKPENVSYLVDIVHELSLR